MKFLDYLPIRLDVHSLWCVPCRILSGCGDFDCIGGGFFGGGGQPQPPVEPKSKGNQALDFIGGLIGGKKDGTKGSKEPIPTVVPLPVVACSLYSFRICVREHITQTVTSPAHIVVLSHSGVFLTFIVPHSPMFPGFSFLFFKFCA